MDEFNIKQREWFVDYWADFVKNNPDKEWSRQQNLLVNSMLKSAKQFSREEYLELIEEKFVEVY